MKAIEHRNIAICLDRMRYNTTINDLAAKYSLSPSTINNAISWGEEKGVFRIDLQISVEKHILDARDAIEKLEKRLNKILDMCEAHDGTYTDKYGGVKYKLISPRYYIPIFTELREQRTLLMELEGVYKKQVNIGEISVSNNNIFILPAKMDPKEWEDMAQKTPAELRKLIENKREKIVS